MRFAEPAYLLLLIAVGIGLWVSYRHVHGMMRSRKNLSFVLRALLAASLVLALAGPEARRPNEGLCIVFLLDRSDSITDADKKSAIEFINKSLAGLGPKDAAGIIAFGRDAVVDVVPSNVRKLTRILSMTDGSGTNLASAIRLASASFPDGKAKRIVVLSDGNETEGESVEAASVASTDHIQIDYVALGKAEVGAEVAVLDLQSSVEVRRGQPSDVLVNVDSTRTTRALVQLDRSGLVVKESTVQLTPGHNRLLLGDVIDSPGFHRYRATILAQEDTDERNNVGVGFVSVHGRPKVLVLQQDPSASPLASAIRQQGIVVDLFGPSGMPTRAEELQGYDAVVLNDINAASTTVRQMRLLENAIKDSGVGFAMVGGENSFLPGGWYGTPIADALPVDLNIRQRKSYPATSILIVVDASGSMSMIEDGVEKIRLAAKAAETTVQLMAPSDRVGVAGSTDGIEFVAPMQDAANKNAVISQIRKLATGGGGIYCRPSMEFAQRTLRSENTKVRHLILLADGADCDQQEGSLEIAHTMRAQKITTSVVAIGDGPHVPFLKRLASVGGGHYYLARKAGQLPAIFTQDAAVMSRSAIEEGVFLPKSVPGEEILRGISPNSVPALYAYCLASDRALAQTGMRTAKNDPLLATWQYGLGKTLAFTSDSQPRWAARWMQWPQFGAFWTQAIRDISRRTAENEYQLTARHDGGKGILEVKAFDRFGSPLNAIDSKVHVSTPEGKSLEVSLTQQAPGTYKGEFLATELGSYIVTVTEASPLGPRVSVSGFSNPYPPEYRRFRSNTPLLERMSESTGGMAIQNPMDAARRATDHGFSVTPLWAFFVLAAVLMLPLDVGARRIAIPIGAIFVALMSLRHRSKQAPGTPDPRVERLRKAKERASPPTEQREYQPDPQTLTEQPSPKEHIEQPAERSTASRLLDAKRRRK